MPGRCGDEPGLLRRVSDDFGVITRSGPTTLTPGDTPPCASVRAVIPGRLSPTSCGSRPQAHEGLGFSGDWAPPPRAVSREPQEPAPQPGLRSRAERAGQHVD